jgi:hypothetical protein
LRTCETAVFDQKVGRVETSAERAFVEFDLAGEVFPSSAVLMRYAVARSTVALN